jgi:pyruvate formate lyase activating enzyme
MQEAAFYTKLDEGKVRCNLCARHCVIADNKHGFCGVRVNRGGTLYAATYAKIAAEAVDPIEKKPLFHFLPGTDVYSLGSVGCNFRCEHCQNWHISQADPTMPGLRTLSPEDGVRRAAESGCRSIAWTYNEPTIQYEYIRDMGTLARTNGLGTIAVTNGYITPEALGALDGILQAFRVDIKAFTDDFYKKVCTARLEPVLTAIIKAKELGMHIETVTLVIPGLNDSSDEMRRLIRWTYEECGPDTPMHFTRFHPDYHLTSIPATPVKTLENICAMAREEGMNYTYLGNVPGHPLEHTYCPECGALLIERSGYQTRFAGLEGSECRACGAHIPVIRRV